MVSWLDNVPIPMDANGCVVPLDTKELVHKGETRKVYGFIYGTRLRHWFVEFEEFDGISLSSCTMPDSWESLEEDAKKAPRDYVEERGIEVGSGGRVVTMTSDILRRAKALAERDAKASTSQSSSHEAKEADRD